MLGYYFINVYVTEMLAIQKSHLLLLLFKKKKTQKRFLHFLQLFKKSTTVAFHQGRNFKDK